MNYKTGTAVFMQRRGCRWVLVGALVFPGYALAQDLVWPSPPDVPRIRYLAAFPDAPESAPAPVVEDESMIAKTLRFILGTPEPAPRHERGVESDLMRPTAAWVSGADVYIADVGRRRIVKYNMETERFEVFPKYRSRRFQSPVGVVVTKSGKIIVSDPVAGAIHTISPAGKIMGEIAPPKQGWARPTGLALDEINDRLFVADTAGHCIHAYSSGGAYLFTFGRRGDRTGEFNFPTYLWADGKRKRLVVCDSLNFRIQFFDYSGKYLGGFGESGNRPGYLVRPRGLCVDSDGNIYVVDAALEAVQIFDSEGHFLLYFGMGGSDPGFFSLPGGIFADGNDRVYVADSYNARMQVFEYLREAKL